MGNYMVAFKGREHQSMGTKAKKFRWTSLCSQERNFLRKIHFIHEESGESVCPNCLSDGPDTIDPPYKIASFIKSASTFNKIGWR